MNQYRIFYAVAQAGSISKASRNLYISQPAVSKSVSKLEGALDVSLLHRTRKGISLTIEGQTLYEQLEVAFNAIELGEKRIKNLRSLGVGKIKIGVSASLCRFVLLPYLKGFINENPHISITIDCQSSAQTVKLLEQGKIEVGLVVKQDGATDEDFISISDLEDIFVATQTYVDNLVERMEVKNPSTTEVLKNANLMLLDEENLTRMYVDEYLLKNGIAVQKFIEVSNMDLLIEFAKISMGVACVIREFASNDILEGRLVELPLDSPMNKRTVGFIFPKERLESEAVLKFKNWVTDNKNRIDIDN